MVRAVLEQVQARAGRVVKMSTVGLVLAQARALNLDQAQALEVQGEMAVTL